MRKISRPPFFFLAIILVAICIISAVFFLQAPNSVKVPVGGNGSQILEKENSAHPTTGTPGPITITSVLAKPGTSTVRITGTATLPDNSGILFEVWPVDIAVRKKSTTEVNGFSSRVNVSGSAGSAAWFAEFDTGTWNDGQYIVRAWPEQSDPRYGDQKMFSLPLNETILHGAGIYSGSGEDLLTLSLPTETSGMEVAVTPIPTPA